LSTAIAIGLSANVRPSDAAEAPQTQQKQQSDSQSSTSLEEITVTAQKRTERLQDVPIAITALTPASLDRYGITDIKGLTKITPNVAVESISVGPASVSVFIRGAGERSQEPLHDQPNGISMDGVNLIGFAGSLLDTFDVQQVEVLRGPQGTLQGRNSVGGAINLTSRRPTFEDHAELEVGGGNFQAFEGKFMVEGALVPDKVAGKIAFSTENRQGFIRNTSVPDSPFGSVESYFGRAGLLITPMDKVDIYLTFDYAMTRPGQLTHSADDNIAYPALASNHAPADLQTVSANCAVYNYCTPDPNWQTSATFTAKHLMKAGGLASNINVNFGAAKLTSVTGFRRSAEHQNIDLDASSTPLFQVVDRHLVQNQFSEELRLASERGGGADFNGKMDWVVGLYTMHYHFDLTEPVFLNIVGVGLPQAACPFIPGARTDLPVPGCYLDLSGYRQQWLNSHAAFAHATWRFTDDFSTFAGVRYTHDKKDYDQNANVGGAIVTPAGQSYSLTNTNTSFDAGFQYKITPDNMAYFHFSQGYRAGGFNSDSLPNVADTYSPEKVNNFEVGLKSEVFDRRLSMNLAIFREDYKDMQRDVVHFLGNQVFQSASNAAKAKIQGAELEATAVPVADLKLQLSFGYLDAKYLSYVNAGVDESSLRIPFTPKTTLSAAADYTFHLPSNPAFSLLTAGVDVQHKSAYTTAPTDDPVNFQDAFTKLNARLELNDQSRKYAVILWGSNLTNKHTILNGEIDGNLNHFQTEDLPRMYGLRFSAKF
jgi:iron complex outermembrane receptor protein